MFKLTRDPTRDTLAGPRDWAHFTIEPPLPKDVRDEFVQRWVQQDGPRSRGTDVLAVHFHPDTAASLWLDVTGAPEVYTSETGARLTTTESFQPWLEMYLDAAEARVAREEEQREREHQESLRKRQERLARLRSR